jgi:hypothetical protein
MESGALEKGKDITVTNGANTQSVTPTSDETFTVGDIRTKLKDVLNIAPNAIATINGEEVDDTRLLSPGDNLQFIKRSGSKG